MSRLGPRWARLSIRGSARKTHSWPAIRPAYRIWRAVCPSAAGVDDPESLVSVSPGDQITPGGANVSLGHDRKASNVRERTKAHFRKAAAVVRDIRARLSNQSIEGTQLQQFQLLPRHPFRVAQGGENPLLDLPIAEVAEMESIRRDTKFLCPNWRSEVQVGHQTIHAGSSCKIHTMMSPQQPLVQVPVRKRRGGRHQRDNPAQSCPGIHLACRRRHHVRISCGHFQGLTSPTRYCPAPLANPSIRLAWSEHTILRITQRRPRRDRQTWTTGQQADA